MKKTFLLLLCLISLSLLLTDIAESAEVSELKASQSPQVISLNTYHTHPPFIIEDSKGLSYDLAAYLTAKSEGQYEFIVKCMSRPRVNKTLAEQKNGIVAWVNPVWFKDVEETKFMWTKGAFMEDGNSIISHREKKVVYEGPYSLDGMVFGGLHGHVYQGIDEYIATSNKLVRVNAENHIDNFRKLAKRRIDATLTPTSGALYLINRENLGDTLYISPKQHSRFMRKAIIVDRNPEMLAFMESVLASLDGDFIWKEIMRRYK